MRVIYLDSLIWLELTVDTVLLWAAGKLCLARRAPVRLLLAGAAGSLYAVLTVFWPPAASLPGKAASLLILLLIAYGREPRLWRIGLAFLALCALFAGVCAAVAAAAGRVTARALLFSAGASLGLCALPFRFAGRKGGKCSLFLRGEGGAVTLPAFRDTGQRLTDPFSGRPVVIADERELRPLFSPETRRILTETEGLSPEERLYALGRGFCLLPLRTVSGDALALSASVPEARLDGNDLGSCRVVFSRRPIEADGCRALIGGDAAT